MRKFITTIILICSINASAESAKVTINYPNKEEKIFRFHKGDESKKIDLGSSWSLCQISFDDESKYVEVGCSPSINGKLLTDRFRYYSARASCLIDLPSGMILYDMTPNEKNKSKVVGYSIRVECEK